MSENIQFSTGIKTFTLNDSCEISFNPSSAAFAEKLSNAVVLLGDKHKEFGEKASKPENKSKTHDLYMECDSEMRKIIDDTLGAPVSEAVIPAGYCVLDFADDLPMWANIMLAVFEKMDESVSQIKNKAKERIRKYSAKYTKK